MCFFLHFVALLYHNYFLGNHGEVKQWKEYPGKSIHIDFYVDGRLDLMYKRDEFVGSKVIEYFNGRVDHLIKRTVEYTIDKSLVGNRIFPLPGMTLSDELYILAMSQIYESDNTMIPGNDIYSRLYNVRDGKLVTQYHYSVNNINAKIKTYFHTKAGLILTSNNSNINTNNNNSLNNNTMNNNNSVLPLLSNDLSLSQEIGLDENIESLHEASSNERDCYTSIKSSFQSIVKLLNVRLDNESNVIHERTVYEQAIDKAHEISKNKNIDVIEVTDISITKTSDYLTPFLRHIKDISYITKDEGLEIRQNCLDALKARLVERANIIQSRLNEENAKLGRKQEQFQRSQREGDFSTEEYEKYCTEAMFRIQILEQRLSSHEEAALKRFADLDMKLSNDSRLKVLKG